MLRLKPDSIISISCTRPFSVVLVLLTTVQEGSMAPTWVVRMMGGVGMCMVGNGAVMGSVVQGSGFEAAIGILRNERRSLRIFTSGLKMQQSPRWQNVTSKYQLPHSSHSLSF